MLYLERRPHHAPTRLHKFPGATTIPALTRGIGVSPRRLSQFFQQAGQLMHLGADIHWAEFALTCGFYDPSHSSTTSTPSPA
jgi:hypothetical protein